MGTPADLGVGAVAVEGLAPLWQSLLLLERPVAVVAAARTLI
jgi:hypothetical protein